MENIIGDEEYEAISRVGWLKREHFLSAKLCQTLCADLVTLQESGALTRAGIGRGSQHQQADHIRTDHTYWLDGESAPQREFLNIMDDLRQNFNRTLFLGLQNYEAHYASYQPGGFYKKHLDSFKGKKNRILSTVIYLTPDCTQSDEGHLVLYDAQDQNLEIGRVLPTQGTLACFISEDIPHEVLPPKRERVSIAGWFRAHSNDIIIP